ncbi:unnamed protein product [Cyprideis torosa]|uniref:Uncharacterized protein n=1 Tax=Cyprideis torosa TaxID=163714 RepID=A0A7R8ZHS6_9CRUS|nr:unnamed protein product [Cyprideis torosa]CAG0883170.1 unnamed protein product [Cyprideis torosa]
MGPRKSQFILDSISDQNPMDMQFLRTFSLLSMGENDVSDEGIEVVWIKKLETESTASFKCCGAPRTASVSLAPRSGGRKPMLRRCQLCGLEGLPPSESSACQQSSASPRNSWVPSTLSFSATQPSSSPSIFSQVPQSTIYDLSAKGIFRTR